MRPSFKKELKNMETKTFGPAWMSAVQMCVWGINKAGIKGEVILQRTRLAVNLTVVNITI